MSALLSVILVLLLVCNIRLLAGSRLLALIQTVALQGVMLAALPLLLPLEGNTRIHAPTLALAVVIIKGVVIPRLLARALRTTTTHREVEPTVGYNLSLLAGIGMLLLALWLGQQLELPGSGSVPLLASVSLFTLSTGLFLVIARRQALTQVVGYLVFENGIYGIGLALLSEQPLLVEMGVLFDIVVGILVMGLVVFQLESHLGHSDASRLQRLRD